jgi:hypothetical protein
MPHTTKKQRREDDRQGRVAADNNFSVGFDDLSVDMLAVAENDNSAAFDDLSDVLPNILGFLPVENIMRSRRINKKLMEAVKKAIVPLTNFRVDCVENYNTMTVMTEAMPNLQQIELSNIGEGRIIIDGEEDFEFSHRYSDGEDPNEERTAETADYRRTYGDIGIVSTFSKLRILKIYGECLNGRYPFLFNSFPLLQKLSINFCHYLKWDLEMLAGFPMLKELDCAHNCDLTGNINSLRVLKDTLEKVEIVCSRSVEGNFMNLADFPRLKQLNLIGTAATGDIRDIGVNDFSSLKKLVLPHGVYGGVDCELKRISDAPDLARSLYLLKKQRPSLNMAYWRGQLSKDSPDWYVPADFNGYSLLLTVHVVKAGTRLGYQWQTNKHWCEVNWLDPEPDSGNEYGKDIDIDDLQDVDEIHEVDMFTGLHQPPTEEEYHTLLAEYPERDEGSEESDSEGYSEYNESDEER